MSIVMCMDTPRLHDYLWVGEDVMKMQSFTVLLMQKKIINTITLSFENKVVTQ